MVQTLLSASQLGSMMLGMLKSMVSAAALALALVIASLSEPAPLSSVLVTVKVEAWAGLAASPKKKKSATTTTPAKANNLALLARISPIASERLLLIAIFSFSFVRGRLQRETLREAVSHCHEAKVL